MDKKVKCKGCGKLFEKRLLSRKGYCFMCGVDNMFECRRQMRVKKGPYYEKWKGQYIAGMKGYLERLEKEEK